MVIVTSCILLIELNANFVQKKKLFSAFSDSAGLAQTTTVRMDIYDNECLPGMFHRASIPGSSRV